MSGARAARHCFRAWDGAGTVEPLTPEQVLSALRDELLNADPDRALSRALHRGLTSDDAQLAGLDPLRDDLRRGLEEAQASFADNPAMSDLLRALGERESGGTGLPGEAQRLLNALAADPAQAGRVLAAAGTEARAQLRDALGQITGGAPVGGDLGATATFSATLEQLTRLLDLSDLEQALRSVRAVSDVLDIDGALVRRALDDGARDRLLALGQSLAEFESSGYLQSDGSRRALSARAVQQIGSELLQVTLRSLQSRRPGDHRDPRAGLGLEHSGASRDYRFGDPFDLNLSQTVLAAVKRGSGTPVRLLPADLTIFEREESSRMATVLAVDLSRSMGERGYLLAAKRMALTLGMLIRTRFPRDELRLVGFSESARLLDLGEITGLSWDRYSFGTNVQDAVRLGRALLDRRRGMQRNLIIITDGEPTAYRDVDGAPRFSHPPTAETLATTYAEAERCRRERIVVTVALLSEAQRVVKFAEEFSRRAGGSVIVADPAALDAAVLLRYGALRISG